METLIGAVLGGALAIAGALMGARSSDRSERLRRQTERELASMMEVVSALQNLVRRQIQVALLPKSPSSASHSAFEAYHEAVVAWNVAIYSALVMSPEAAANKIIDLDREVGRVFELASSKTWTPDEFKVVRREIGRLAASYLMIVRQHFGGRDLPVFSIWTWDRPGS